MTSAEGFGAAATPWSAVQLAAWKAIKDVESHQGRNRVSKAKKCVYCGQLATTSDHVPPKTLFSKPRPSSLVTVPSCEACNQGASLDDEYFRLIISMRHDLDHPDARLAREAAMRGLARPEASGLRTSFLGSTQYVDLVTAAGLYVGRTMSYEFDVERLDRVARRIILGLFYKERGRPLPDGYTARVMLPAALDLALAPRNAMREFRNLATTLKESGPPQFIGRRVFAYWWLPIGTKDRNATAWLMIFYERVMYLGFTAPATVAQSAAI